MAALRLPATLGSAARDDWQQAWSQYSAMQVEDNLSSQHHYFGEGSGGQRSLKGDRYPKKILSFICANMQFLQRDALLSAVYAVVVCLSVCLCVCVCVCVCVCLSHSGIVSKRLNVGSRK